MFLTKFVLSARANIMRGVSQCVCVKKPSGIRKHRTGIQKVKIFTISKVI